MQVVMSSKLSWFIVVSFISLTRGQVTEESSLNVTVDLGRPFDFKSPGFPTCCVNTSQTYYFRCQSSDDEPSQPCYFRIYFIDVDLPRGSFVKLYESDGRLLDSISQVWDEVEDTWHRPVVASSTNEIKVNVHLENSSWDMSDTPYVGFRAILHTTKVPGQENWADYAYTTSCPALGALETGVVAVRPIGNEGLLQDCIWQLKGVKRCKLYVNINEVQGAQVQIHRGLSSVAPFAQERVQSGQLMTSEQGIFIRMQKPDNTGVFIFTYGCFLEEDTYMVRPDPGSYTDTSPSYCESSRTPPVGVVCEDRSTCISVHARCNGYSDCRDSSDEVNCEVLPSRIPTSREPPSVWKPTAFPTSFGRRPCEPNNPIPCRSGVGCYRPADICDGTRHCADGTDELGCDPTDKRRHHDSSGVMYAVCLVPLAALILAFVAYYRIKLRRSLSSRAFSGVRSARSGRCPCPPPDYSIAIGQPKPEHVFTCLPDYDTLYGLDGPQAQVGAPPAYSRDPPPDSISPHQTSDSNGRDQLVLPPTQQLQLLGAPRDAGHDNAGFTMSRDRRCSPDGIIYDIRDLEGLVPTYSIRHTSSVYPPHPRGSAC